MQNTSVPPIIPSKLLTDDERKKLFSFMLQAREFDAAFLRLYRQGRAFGGVYSQKGNEAVSVGSAYALNQSDAFFPMHRNIGGHFVRGQDLDALMLNHLAREGSMMRGTDGTGHYADPEKNIYGNVSHLAAMIPVAAGYILAEKMKGNNSVAMTYIGDGGAQVGEFHEGVNFAAVQNLPLIVIIENNQYAYSSPNSIEFACEKLSDRAVGYGIKGTTIDGTDIELVYETCKQGIDSCRASSMPMLIETETMRMRGHAEHDDFGYVPQEVLDYWEPRDPLKRYQEFLIKETIMLEDDINQLRTILKTDINNAIDSAVQKPFPNSIEGRKSVFVNS